MTDSVKLISNTTIKDLLTYDDLIPAIEEGLKDFSNGDVKQPVRSVIPLQDNKGFFASMPAFNVCKNVLAIKCLCFHPDNSALNLPTHNSQILLYQPTNGLILAMMDGDVITEMRTAAASAVATKYLAKKDSEVLTVLGAGVQGKSHIFALCNQHKFKKILVWNRNPENGLKLCKLVEALAEEVQFCSSVEDAVSQADIIVTATSSTMPVVNGNYLKEGVHINCVGACRPDWRELDDDCMKMCDVYVDSKASAATESGDIILSKAKVLGEIGELVSGVVKADRNKKTIFKSLGIAVEDAVAAAVVWNKFNVEK